MSYRLTKKIEVADKVCTLFSVHTFQIPAPLQKLEGNKKKRIGVRVWCTLVHTLTRVFSLLPRFWRGAGIWWRLCSAGRCAHFISDLDEKKNVKKPPYFAVFWACWPSKHDHFEKSRQKTRTSDELAVLYNWGEISKGLKMPINYRIAGGI